MKVNQIAEILNQTYQELIGESALVAEDLSNIVEVGRQITSTTQWGDNFDKYVGKIIDKVGKTIMWDRVYRSTAPAIRKDAWTYGSILEKIRVEAPDFKENKEWDLANYKPDEIFTFSPPTVHVKYFNKKTTFMTKISITKKQAESAFQSSKDMNAFISMIENAVSNKMGMAMDSLVYRTIANLIAEKYNANHNVVNLLEQFNDMTGRTEKGEGLDAANCLYNKEFLNYAQRTITLYKSLMSRPSKLYSNDGYVVFTPADKLKALFLEDFAMALDGSLYSETFHNEFVKLEGFSQVPYWQGGGLDDSFESRSAIKVIPASQADKADKSTIDANGIIAVLFDDEAAMVCNEEPEVRSIYNPEANFYNYWHTFDASYFNDTAENCVVFTIGTDKSDRKQ